MTSRSDGVSRPAPQDSSISVPPASSQTQSYEQTKADQPLNSSRASVTVPSRTSAGTASGPQSLTASRSPSAANSPWSSRDSSPAGRPPRQQSTTVANRGMRSRKNSHDVSPSRSNQMPTSTVPSAAAIQRALSAAAAPQLQPTSATEQPSRIPRTQRSATNNEGSPQWPVSPRLKSPPPSGDPRRSSLRKTESTSVAPNIVVQPSTPASSNEDVSNLGENLQKEVAARSVSAAKASSRTGSGAPKLETVQEASLPTSPGFPQEGVMSSGESKYSGILSEDDRLVQSPTKTPRTTSKSAKGNSDSDSGDRIQSPNQKTRSTDPDTTPRPKTVSTKTSLSSLQPKSGVEPTTKNMTVETEIVNSVAQATLSAPDRSSSGRADTGGALKAKASNDTIKPKKERKKQSRKAPSINAASGRSKSSYSAMQADSVGQPLSRFNQHHRLRRPNLRPRADTAAPFPKRDTFSITQTVNSDLVSLSSTPDSFSLAQSAPAKAWWPFPHFRYSSADRRPREASTRADKFEAQVLDAMDQASSDDSDETFVYESNPPETTPHRSRGRHHSRTPSATSLTSMAEQRGNMRSIANVLDPQRPMQKSRSMKFTNAYSSGDNEDIDRGDGTIRATNTSRGNSSMHHHHLGRQSRNATNHTSIIDDNNPTFPNISKQRSLTGVAGRGSHNARLAAQNLRVSNSTIKRNGDGYTSYDMDDEPADDERTPLVGTVRSNRNGPRTPRAARRYEPYPRYRRSIVSRFAGCIVLVIMLLLLACGVVGFLFAISKPLSDVAILEIQHVLASEQELMLDVVVEATNPNLLPISISDMDVNIFAKSKYVGSEKWWRDHPDLPASDHVTKRRQEYRKNSTAETGDETEDLRIFDDDSSDPFPDDGSGNKQTMLLGHIYHFDNPLSFDGSFWRRHPHYSTASLRLNKPGNRTELGGTERWERVIEHPFELIVRGVLKYQIPLGGSKHSASVSSSTTVQPEKGIDDPDDEFKIKSTPPVLRLRFARSEYVQPATDRPSLKERLMAIFLED